MRCGECYELKYWERQPAPTKVYFPQGAGLHEAVYWARLNTAERGDFDLDEALDQAKRGYASNLLLSTDNDGNPERFPPDKPTGDLVLEVERADESGDIRVEDGNGGVLKATDGISEMLRWTKATLPFLIEREKAIGWKALEADVETHFPFPFRARIDAQLADDSINDVKSASKKEAPDWYTVFQTTLYALPRWEARELQHVRLSIAQVTKTKIPGLWYYACEPTDQQMAETRDLLMQTAEDIHNGIFRRRPSRFCDYNHGLPKFLSAA